MVMPLPRRVWFPRCGADPSWRDAQGESELPTCLCRPVRTSSGESFAWRAGYFPETQLAEAVMAN